MASMTDTLAANDNTSPTTSYTGTQGNTLSDTSGVQGTSTATDTNPTSGTGVQQAASSGVTPNSSVVDTMNQITNQDSPVMQQAAAAAKRNAARSGMMNSSLAIGAAQGAVTQQASDLAKSEVAANQNQQTISNQQSQYDRSQAEQERANQVQEGQSQQTIENQQSQFESSLTQQQAESAQQNEQFLQNLDLQNKQLQASSDQFAQSIQANVRGSYTDAANNIINNSSVNINNIASNANLKQADKDALIAQELKNRNNDLAYLKEMYSGIQGWADQL